MKDKHIIDILENAPFADLTESESTLIRAHVEGCATCHRAYQAAQLSALLIKERTAEAIDPSPFFHTKVMAGCRASTRPGAPVEIGGCVCFFARCDHSCTRGF